MSDFKAKMHQNPTFGWALPQTPLKELTALPRPLAGFKGPASKRRGVEGMEREETGGRGWERTGGKGREGEWSLVESKKSLK